MRSKGRLSDEDIHSSLRELRIALLEGDVNLDVVKNVVSRVEEKAKEQRVIESIAPAEQVITILYNELITILGDPAPLKVDPNVLNFIMLVGLQGNGKTTTSVKLAHFLREKGMKVLLVPFDFKRPAAREQLMVLGGRDGIPVFNDSSENPDIVINNAFKYLKDGGFNVAILDTAGRKEIDVEVMNELKYIKDVLHPSEILLVMDGTIGQGALTVARSFNEEISLTGAIFTKFDSSAKGGSVLSFRYVTGKPVKFLGVGENVEDIEVFDPRRLISRILGRGDIQTLVEKVERTISEQESEELAKKVLDGKFTLKDFKEELLRFKKMGGISSVVSYLPSIPNFKIPKDFSDEKMIKKMVAIIDSMTEEERDDPDIVNGSRRARIAKGAGVEKHDVNVLLKNFSTFRKLSKNLEDIDRIFKFS